MSYHCQTCTIALQLRTHRVYITRDRTFRGDLRGLGKSYRSHLLCRIMRRSFLVWPTELEITHNPSINTGSVWGGVQGFIKSHLLSRAKMRGEGYRFCATGRTSIHSDDAHKAAGLYHHNQTYMKHLPRWAVFEQDIRGGHALAGGHRCLRALSAAESLLWGGLRNGSSDVPLLTRSLSP